MRSATSPVILIIGACGQIGTELTVALRNLYGEQNVIASDQYRQSPAGIANYISLDVMDSRQLQLIVREKSVSQIYLLAEVLSVNGEKDTNAAWNLSMQSLISVLNIARDQKLDKIFWPSSIAVFGHGSPRYNCPQYTTINPSTVYGVSKSVGEYWCNYYFDRYGVDVRSIRFPGLIFNYTANPGIRITGYAVEMFHQAVNTGYYESFLDESTALPMLYMKDAIRAMLELMSAPAKNLSIRKSYNLAGMSFAPCDLAAEIKRHIPEFVVSYRPDSRQVIADSWPASINGAEAWNDWGWKPHYNLQAMTAEMIEYISMNKKADHKEIRPYPDFQPEDVASI